MMILPKAVAACECGMWLVISTCRLIIIIFDVKHHGSAALHFCASFVMFCDRAFSGPTALFL